MEITVVQEKTKTIYFDSKGKVIENPTPEEKLYCTIFGKITQEREIKIIQKEGYTSKKRLLEIIDFAIEDGLVVEIRN